MKPLKQYPHLFANGKFSIKHGDSTFPVTGYDSREGAIEVLNDIGNRIYCIAKECTLIARPISDMTDEELYHFFEAYADGKGDAYLGMFNRDELVGTATDTRKASEQMLYLLSIGVYPFDQQAFESGTVIDINEV